MSIVKRLLGEASEDVRFDTNARLEIWITLDDLEFDRRVEKLKNDARPVEEKVAEAKKVALELAYEMVRTKSTGDFNISADFGLEALNVDRIDWQALVSPAEVDEG